MGSKLYLFLFFFVLMSCGITKRHYRPGFFVQHRSFSIGSHQQEMQDEKMAEEKQVVEEKTDGALKEVVVPVSFVEILPGIENEIEISTERLDENKGVYPAETKSVKQENSFINENRASTLHQEPVYDDNVQLAEWYLTRANHYTLVTILFGWTVLGLFIFGPLALNRAKRAIFLNDKAIADIDTDAMRDIKIVKLYFSIVSILLLLSLFIVLVTL